MCHSEISVNGTAELKEEAYWSWQEESAGLIQLPTCFLSQHSRHLNYLPEVELEEYQIPKEVFKRSTRHYNERQKPTIVFMCLWFIYLKSFHPGRCFSISHYLAPSPVLFSMYHKLLLDLRLAYFWLYLSSLSKSIHGL